MKVKKGMILAAGFGRRMMPITEKIPKPLLKIGKVTLLENCILKLKDFGIEEVVINTHYLSNQIKYYLNEKNFDLKINIVEEKYILDTGGGILNATSRYADDPFIVLNPDTIWNQKHIEEFKMLEKIYFDTMHTALLLVNKSMSFDKSFKGDFNINDKGLISRDKSNLMVYIGAQIINRKIFKNFKIKSFSMNDIWDKLIKKNSLVGIESKQKFLHLNNSETYKKLLNEKTIH